MQVWRERLVAAAAYLSVLAFGALLVYVVFQGWVEGQESRLVTTAAVVAIALLTGLLWKRVAPWSKAALIFAGTTLLVGGLAVYYSTRAADSFAIGPFSLVVLVDLLMLVAVLLSGIAVALGARLPRALRIGAAALALVCAYPFAYGALHRVALPDLFAGAGFSEELPLYVQPAVLGAAVWAPLLFVLLLVRCLRGIRSPERSTLQATLLVLAAGVPLVICARVLLDLPSRGLALRTFAGHTYQGLVASRVVDRPILEEGAALRGTDPGAGFWAEWAGQLTLPQGGVYEFGIDGDGFLYLDGRLAIARGAGTGKVELRPGVHRLRAASIQSGAVKAFEIRWRAEGEEELAAIAGNRLSHEPADLLWRRSPRQAAQVGIDWLQSASVAWQRSHGCYGCHVQAQTLMGLSIAERNRYEVNRDYVRELDEYTRSQQVEAGNYHSKGSHPRSSTAYAAMALAYISKRHGDFDDEQLRKAAGWLLTQQTPAGVIPADLVNAPISQGDLTPTANSLVAFQRMLALDGDERYEAAARRARQWILAAEPATTQDRSHQLLTLARFGEPEEKAARMEGLVRALAAQAGEDGGWRETPGMPGSNAYATGQALYALKLAGMSVNDPVFKAGVLYLLESQEITGSWRARNTQSSSKTEFAPTMWAVIGLAGSFGAIVPELVMDDGCVLVDGDVTFEAKVANFTESPIESVSFEVDGAPLGTAEVDAAGAARSAPWNAAAAPPGPHEVAVIATNADGETGSDGATAYSGGPFSLHIESPADGQYVSQKVACRARLSNPAELPVEAVEFFLDDQPVGTAGAEPFEIDCSLEALPDGPHTLRASARGCALEAESRVAFAVGPETGPGLLDVRLRTEGEQVLSLSPDNLELVLDMSGSMWGRKAGRAKYEIAREVFASVARELPPETSLGVRVYGHRHKGRCDDTELIAPLGALDREALIQRVDALRPLGKTPIDASLRATQGDLQNLEGNKTVILLTDGIETCRGDPVKASEDLVAAGLNLRVHVVGFDLGDAPDAVVQLRQVAEKGRGRFYLAESADQLTAALTEAVQVRYSIYDAGGDLVSSPPVGGPPVELMSGSYRIELAVDPPLTLDAVVVSRDATTIVEVVKEGRKLRLETR